MEMPVDVLNNRLGKIRDNGDIDFDNTAAAVDIDSELQEKFLFFPIEEIEAVEIEDDRGRLNAGSGPEHCAAGVEENPNWLYNHALNALALYFRIKGEQEKKEQEARREEERLAKRPEPGIYQGWNGFSYFPVIVPADRRVLVQQAASSGLIDKSDVWDATENGPWSLQRINLTDGTVSA